MLVILSAQDRLLSAATHGRTLETAAGEAGGDVGTQSVPTQAAEACWSAGLVGTRLGFSAGGRGGS